MNAKKTSFTEEAVLELARAVDQIYSSKGRQVIHIDVKKDKPDRETLLGVLLGPTGKLRAPTLRTGRTLLVGFDSATYQKVLGS